MNIIPDDCLSSLVVHSNNILLMHLQGLEHQATLCSNGAIAALAPLLSSENYKV